MPKYNYYIVLDNDNRDKLNSINENVSCPHRLAERYAEVQNAIDDERTMGNIDTEYVAVESVDISPSDEVYESGLRVLGYNKMPPDTAEPEGNWWNNNGTEIFTFFLCEINKDEP